MKARTAFVVGCVLTGLLTGQSTQIPSRSGHAHAAVIEGTADRPGQISTGHSEAIAARHEKAAEIRRQTNRALYQSTVQFRLATMGKEEEYGLMAAAVAAVEAGKSATETIKTVGRMRQSQHQRRSTLADGGRSLSPEVQSIVIDAAAVAGGMASSKTGAVSGLGARIALVAIDAWERDTRTYWAYRELSKERKTLPELQRDILKRWSDAYEKYPQLREVDSVAFKPVLGISPNSTREELIASSPLKQVKELVELVATRQDDHEVLTRKVVDSLRTVRDLQTEHTKSTVKELKDIQGLLKQDQLSRAKMARAERRQQADAIKLRGAQATVYLAATLIGMRDPHLGRQIQTVGDATIQVYTALKTFNKVTKEFGKLKGFATAALSADVVGATLAVVGLFIDTGPTPDEMIIREIGALKDQVEQVRNQMHQRFNVVDKRLGEIHNDLVSGLEKLGVILAQNREEASQHSMRIQLTLRAQHRMLADLYPLTVDRSKAILESITDHALAPCIYRSGSTTLPLTPEAFARCLTLIRGTVLNGELERRQIPPSKSLDYIHQINDFPDETANAAAIAFREHLPEDLRPSVVIPVVGPESWITLARAHDQFQHDWPEFNEHARTASEYVNKMREYRARFEALIRAIGHDLTRYADTSDEAQGPPPTAIGTLVAKVRANARHVRRAIRDAGRMWRREWRARQRTGNDSTDFALLNWTVRAGRWQRLTPDAFKKVWEDRVAYFPKRTDACPEEALEDLGPEGSALSSWRHLRETDEDNSRWEIRRREEFGNALSKQLRRALPRSIQSLMAIGVGTMKVCVIGAGNNTGPKLFETNIDNEPERGAYYKATIGAEVVAVVKWQAECNGQDVQLDAETSHKESIKLRYWIWPEEGRRRAYHATGFDNRERSNTPEYDLMSSAYWQTIRDLRHEIRGWAEEIEERTTCPQTYRELFGQKRARWVAEHITTQNEVREAVKTYNDNVAVANAYLRAWVRLALHDATRWSDIVAAIATGNVRFPRWEEASVAPNEGSALDQYERLEQRLAAVEAVLKSDELYGMASAHVGYAGLTETAYDSLDPEHPVVEEVQRQWAKR